MLSGKKGALKTQVVTHIGGQSPFRLLKGTDLLISLAGILDPWYSQGIKDSLKRPGKIENWRGLANGRKLEGRDFFVLGSEVGGKHTRFSPLVVLV